MDISRPCQPEKLIPLLPWPGFDPSFSGHNDRRAITSEWTWLRLTQGLQALSSSYYYYTVTSESSRRTTYRDINPSLLRCEYLSKYTIPESDRIALTRIWLGSHHLRVETGRWARIPHELRRICPCSTGFQDQKHVLLSCPKSENLRHSMNLNNCSSIIELFKQDNVAEYCRLILDLYRT